MHHIQEFVEHLMFTREKWDGVVCCILGWLWLCLRAYFSLLKHGSPVQTMITGK